MDTVLFSLLLLLSGTMLGLLLAWYFFNKKTRKPETEEATRQPQDTPLTLEERNAALDTAHKQALQASKAKSEFLANMSHEIRTPMNGVIGFADLLSQSELTAKQSDYVETIRTSAANLLAIVNDILDFSKIESGQLRLENITFDLREIMDDVMALLAPAAHTKGLELILLVYRDVPRRLIGDPVRVRQIAINLVNNAIKFTHQGNVVVRAMIEEESSDEALIRISINDTGIGLSKQEQSKLFQAFSQGDTSATRRFGGTGLGLIISKRLVEAMGGTLGLESARGNGSTFWFKVSWKKQTEIQTEPGPEPLNNYTTLIYDAHPLAKLSIGHTLQNWGASVTDAASLDAICHLLEEAKQHKQTYDMVLLGLGHDQHVRTVIAPLLQSISKNYETPVLVLVGSEDARLLDQLCQWGATSCISKPARSEVLLREITGLSGMPVDIKQIKTENAAPLHKLQVLLADDNDINRKLITVQLQQLGAWVTEAIHGLAALQLARKFPFDLILMDIQMPEMSGDEAAQAIRSENTPNRNTPIIALTANAQPADIKRLLKNGLDDCLIKPIDPATLDKTLARWSGSSLRSSKEEDTAELTTEPSALKLAGGNQQLADEMRALLVNELPEHQNQLKQSHDVGDLRALAEHAHKLHGSAAYCGVPRLKQCVARLEREAQQRKTVNIEQALNDTLDAIQELLP